MAAAGPSSKLVAQIHAPEELSPRRQEPLVNLPHRRRPPPCLRDAASALAPHAVPAPGGGAPLTLRLNPRSDCPLRSTRSVRRRTRSAHRLYRPHDLPPAR
ncbi:hypothetical protein FGB62_196g04 [Gracilaria domingensis]|nr:hypothetical protein FGB62_196g04 [Gracilaria domingensis]